MKNHRTDFLKRAMAILLCAFISFTYMPFFGMEGIASYANANEQAEAVAVAVEAAAPQKATLKDSGEDSDELLMGYLNKELSELTTPKKQSRKLSTKSSSRGERLEGILGDVYNGLKIQISEFADPSTETTRNDSAFTVDSESLTDFEDLPQVQVNTSDKGLINVYTITESELEALNSINANQVLIINALMADMPYEMFWFDKTKEFWIAANYGESYYILKDKDSGETLYGLLEKPYVETSLCISKDYSESGEAGTQVFDLGKIKAVKSTIQNAKTIIDSNSENASAYQIVNNYRNEICNRVTYNGAAAATNGSGVYGDPWQLVYVFDNDPNTNVVCEGYSKAFQYLFDNTAALGNEGIECYTVTGPMSGGTGAGDHMWNILHMDDGRNYIADITNCDQGNSGYPDKLFLKQKRFPARKYDICLL